MKSIKFLQQSRLFADYAVQTPLELSASLPQLDPYSRPITDGARRRELADDQWDGRDRREQNERRASERRNEKLLAMLDTRMRTDRRRLCRRRTDELELRSFSCRV